MDHSHAIEEHARQKLEKIKELFKDDGHVRPLHVEMWLKANKQHVHHRAEVHFKAPHFVVDAHDECPDMYMAIDNATDKLFSLIIKEKEKQRDKNHKKTDTEKNLFRSGK